MTPRHRLRLLLFPLLLLCSLPAPASGSQEGFRRADALYDAGKYQEATEQYGLVLEGALSDAAGGERAAQALYNRGSALYRLGEYARARDSFEEAAVKTRHLDVEAKATYSIGNCSYRAAEAAIAGGNLQQAVQNLEQSIAAYRRSLEIRPESRPAAANLEVARIVLKGVRDELAKYGDVQDLQREIVETLRKLVARQGAIAESAADPDVATLALRDGQASLDEDTRGLLGRFDLLIERLARLQGGNQAANPFTEARRHVQSSEGHQRRAVGHLSAGDRDKALPAQASSLEELKTALDILTPPEREDRSEQGQSNQETGQGERQGTNAPQPGGEPQDQSDRAQGKGSNGSDESGAAGNTGLAERAEDILQGEGDKRRVRDTQLQDSPTPVDKDW